MPCQAAIQAEINSALQDFRFCQPVSNINKCEGIPVVDGEGEVVSWRGEAVTSSPGHGGGEVPAGLEGAAGDCGEHSGEASLK